MSCRILCRLILPVLITGAVSADTARDVKNLTRARTRLVWAQQQDGHADYQATLADFRLMGFDTDDGGERVILSAVDGYGYPLLNHDATRIVYTNRSEGSIYTVNWDGTGQALFKKGFASDIWLNPADSTEWVVAKPWEGEDVPVYRYNIDNPGDSVLLWNMTAVGHGTPFLMQLSYDGTHASGTFPWNGGGLAVLPNGGWTYYADGCQPSISPNNDYMAWVGTLRHRSFDLFDSTGTKLSNVDVHVGRDIRGWEVFHIKWAYNNRRFMTRTGPYSSNSTGSCPSSDCGNRIADGGTNVELHLCRFDENITEIEQYVKVTDNSKADFFGEVWVDPRPAAKQLNLSVDTVRFAALDGAAAPGAQTVYVYAMGVYSAVNATSLDDITVNDDAAWLTTGLTGSGDYRILTVSADQGALEPGTYTATVTITADGVDKLLQVEFIVMDIVRLTAETDTVRLAVYPGGPAPAPVTVKVSSDQGQSLAGLQVSPDAAWVSVTTTITGDTARLATTVDMEKAQQGVNRAMVTATLGDSSVSYVVELTNEQFDITVGLQGYWPFNEGSGAVAGDSSGNGRDGALVDAAWETGHTGSAVRVDAGLKGYVNTGAWDMGETDMTVMCWVYFDGTNGSHMGIVTKGSGGNCTGDRWLFSHSKLGYCVFGSYWRVATGPFYEPLPTGRWVHAAVVLRDTVTTLYFDADSVGTSVFKYCDGVSTPVWIGNTQGRTQPFNGLIDEVRVYDRALAREEIHFIYMGNTGTAIEDPATVPGRTGTGIIMFDLLGRRIFRVPENGVYFRMDEGSGTVVPVVRCR